MRDYADSNMISSSDVNGTDVYGTDREKVGHIDHLVIDKQSGRIAYAVMHFGGFLGMGEESHPIPWNALRYDTGLNGYVTGITRDQLEGAPRAGDDWSRNRDWESRTHQYYGIDSPYWL